MPANLPVLHDPEITADLSIVLTRDPLLHDQAPMVRIYNLMRFLPLTLFLAVICHGEAQEHIYIRIAGQTGRKGNGATHLHTDVKSIEEQAEPYQLGTAKFPIDALTRTWGMGSNRRINEKHVEALYRIFEEQGLQREVPKNHLLVICRRDEYDRMMDHLHTGGVSMPQCCPSFNKWMSVNGNQAEIMAGQHRVEALKLFLSRVGATAMRDQAWWICQVYDKGEARTSDRGPTNICQIDSRTGSRFGFVPIDKIRHYPTVLGRSGWNWPRQQMQTHRSSKDIMGRSRTRCSTCSV
jgi:hypothetical protein